MEKRTPSMPPISRLVVGAVTLANVACTGSVAPPPPESSEPPSIPPPPPSMPPASVGSLPPPSITFSRPPPSFDLTAVTRADLCVTAGSLAAASPDAVDVSVEVPGMRAVVAARSGDAAEIAFRYGGPSAEIAPLANGEVRRQIGLKLRAKNTCNVVYVMWHIEPTPVVSVSVKRNDGLSTHEECGDHGYINLPAQGEPPPPIAAGEVHTLAATIASKRLEVRADGKLVWEGDLPDDAFVFDGPSGVRSDNGRFDFEMRVPWTARGGVCPVF